MATLCFPISKALDQLDLARRSPRRPQPLPAARYPFIPTIPVSATEPRQNSQATGESACPFTTLYWDFLDRHYDQFKKNHRMGMQLKHVAKKRAKDEMPDIRSAARRLKRQFLG